MKWHKKESKMLGMGAIAFMVHLERKIATLERRVWVLEGLEE